MVERGNTALSFELQTTLKDLRLLSIDGRYGFSLFFFHLLLGAHTFLGALTSGFKTLDRNVRIKNRLKIRPLRIVQLRLSHYNDLLAD